MKKLLIFLLSIVCANAWSWDGSGTESNPYLIKDAQDLITLSEKAAQGNNYKGKYFKVVSSIEFEAPLIEKDETGSNFVPIKEFAGHFNGDGHHIKHMVINRPSEDNVAVFSKLTGTLMHLALKDNCTVIGKNNVGGLVAKNQGATISNCENHGTVSGVNYVGGIVGLNSGNLKECINDGNVTGSESVGGIIGAANDYTDATKCSNMGQVIATGDNVGGIVGTGKRFQAIECLNEGNVSGGAMVGGIVGYHDASTTAVTMSISDCTNRGLVSGTTRVGGIAGFHDGPVTGCKNEGTITGSDEQIGGIAGYSKTGNTSDCVNSGIVTSSKNHVGGIIGYVNRNIFVNNCQNSGDVTGVMYVGGITGYGNVVNNGTNSGKITGAGAVGGISGVGKVYEQSSNSGEIVGVVEGNDDTIGVSGIGGIVGGGTVSDATNTGSITANELDSNVGGIMGAGTATNCINKGQITANSTSYAGTYYVGGIVGNGSATNCQNEATILGHIRYAGGIVGMTETTVSKCINKGEIDAEGWEHGGIAGQCTSQATVDNCTNFANVSGQSSAGAIIGYNDTNNLSENYYTENVIVKVGDTSYSGSTPRGIGFGASGKSLFDITENNGAVMKAGPAGIYELTLQKSAMVYNLSGSKIRTSATSLNGLSKGVYIVKGKKVVIK